MFTALMTAGTDDPRCARVLEILVERRILLTNVAIVRADLDAPPIH